MAIPRVDVVVGAVTTFRKSVFVVLRSNCVPRIVTVGVPALVRALKFRMYFLFATKDTALIDDTLAVAAVSVTSYSGPIEALTFPPVTLANKVGA